MKTLPGSGKTEQQPLEEMADRIRTLVGAVEQIGETAVVDGVVCCCECGATAAACDKYTDDAETRGLCCGGGIARHALREWRK